MNLYISNYCPLSQRCLYLIYTKNIQNYFNIVDISYKNHFNKIVPLLIDKDLEIINPHLICEYIEDIFPANSLLTNDFKNRAKIRQSIIAFDKWIIPNLNYLELNKILDKKNPKKNLFIQKIFKKNISFLSNEEIINQFQNLYIQALNKILDYFFQLIPILNKQNYILGNEKTLLDITVLPVLWQLQNNYSINFEEISHNKYLSPNLNINSLIKYCQKNFNHKNFQQIITFTKK